MIEELQIQNFQAHRDSKFEFSPGVNVISGQSHTGKSSTVRALLWLLTNRPQGYAFKSWFVSDDKKAHTIVRVKFDNGEVQRIRSDNDNEYMANDLSLKALRADVPDEVRTIIQVEDYNLQSQFDPFFLLQDTPGEVASKLNMACGLEIIDEYHTKSTARLQQTRNEIQRAEDDVNKLDDQLTKYVFIPVAEKALARLEKLNQQLEKKKADYLTIYRITQQMSDVDIRLARFPNLDLLAKRVEKFEERVKAYDLLCSKRDLLAKLISDLKRVQDKWDVNSEILHFEDDVSQLSGQIAANNAVVQQRNQLKRLLDSLDGVDQKLSSSDGIIQTLEDAYLERLVELGVCPTCGQSTRNL